MFEFLIFIYLLMASQMIFCDMRKDWSLQDDTGSSPSQIKCSLIHIVQQYLLLVGGMGWMDLVTVRQWSYFSQMGHHGAVYQVFPGTA